MAWEEAARQMLLPHGVTLHISDIKRHQISKDIRHQKTPDIKDIRYQKTSDIKRHDTLKYTEYQKTSDRDGMELYSGLGNAGKCILLSNLPKRRGGGLPCHPHHHKKYHHNHNNHFHHHRYLVL